MLRASAGLGPSPLVRPACRPARFGLRASGSKKAYSLPPPVPRSARTWIRCLSRDTVLRVRHA
jgi:hypothetical protein